MGGAGWAILVLCLSGPSVPLPPLSFVEGVQGTSGPSKPFNKYWKNVETWGLNLVRVVVLNQLALMPNIYIFIAKAYLRQVPVAPGIVGLAHVCTT